MRVTVLLAALVLLAAPTAAVSAPPVPDEGGNETTDGTISAPPIPGQGSGSNTSIGAPPVPGNETERKTNKTRGPPEGLLNGFLGFLTQIIPFL
ncbi:MAG: hypothetical protein SV186_03295 [Candidatus Nanohaloarchaea archaeon]|nr:hypothetical protein [Candidatus Nanohaloarchaea archaeon]